MNFASDLRGLVSKSIGEPHPKPAYKITVDGKDITSTFNTRLESLMLVDNRGFETDTLDITLDDSDGRLAIPSRGVSISVALGWERDGKLLGGLVDKGSYTVDEIEHTGTPDKLTLRAKSADLRAGLSTKKERSWSGKTISDMVSTIAAAHNLKPAIAKSLAKLRIEHIDQTHESDANLLTRIARDHDAICTVKNGRLLFMSIGEAESVTGIKFPNITITRAAGDNHRFSMAERDTYTAVTATYQNVKGATTGTVTIDAKGMSTGSAKKSKNALRPSADNTKVLRHVYATKNNAERAVKAEWQRLQRGAATFCLTLAYGRADLFPELPVKVQGFKAEIDSTSWLITRATHNFSDTGFTTALGLELLLNTAL